MKKTAIVNGKARRIEFSYAVGETISLSNTEVKKPWGRVTERVTVSKLTFTINGKTYEGTRTFKVAGGPYSETFEFDGNSFASHKQAIEYTLGACFSAVMRITARMPAFRTRIRITRLRIRMRMSAPSYADFNGVKTLPLGKKQQLFKGY